jgi:hypothetical protein
MAVDFNLFLPLFFWICFSLQIHRSFFGLCLHLLRFRCLAASRRNGRVWVAAGWSPIRLVATALAFAAVVRLRREMLVCVRRGGGREDLLAEAERNVVAGCCGCCSRMGGCRCGAALDYGEAGSARRG